MIKVNGSRLDSIGYQFGLMLRDGSVTCSRSYDEANEIGVRFGGTIVFRELYATEWTEATLDAS